MGYRRRRRPRAAVGKGIRRALFSAADGSLRATFGGRISHRVPVWSPRSVLRRVPRALGVPLCGKAFRTDVATARGNMFMVSRLCSSFWTDDAMLGTEHHGSEYLATAAFRSVESHTFWLRQTWNRHPWK